MEIKITCDVKLYVALQNLHDFQKNLKKLSEEGYEKLKKQILDQGFSSPILIWKNDGKYYTLDGHQRCHTLKRMQAEGYKIPDVPCVEITAKTKLEAKKKLLGYVSQFGKLDAEGLHQYILEAELDVQELDDFDLPDFDVESFKEEFYGEGKEEDDSSEPDMSDENEILVTVSFANEFEAENFYNATKEAGHKCKLIV